MIRSRGVGNAESHGHAVEEAKFGQRRLLRREIITDVKDQLVLAGLQLFRRQQGVVGAAFSVRARCLEEFRLAAGQGPQFNLHSLRGAAVGRIQNVSAQFAGHSWQGS